VTSFGREGAQEILFFNDAYYGLYEACSRMEQEDGNTREPARQGAFWLDRLEASLFKLARQLPEGHALSAELQMYRDRQKQRFKDLTRKNPAPN
jgi:uncharacterized membrane protein YccC